MTVARRLLVAPLLCAAFLLFVSSSASGYRPQPSDGSSSVTNYPDPTLLLGRSTRLLSARLQHYTRRGGSSWKATSQYSKRVPVRVCLRLTAALKVEAIRDGRLVDSGSDTISALGCVVVRRVREVRFMETILWQLTPISLDIKAERKLRRMLNSLQLEDRGVIVDPPQGPPVETPPSTEILPYYPDPVAPDDPTICPQDGKYGGDCDPRPKVRISRAPSTLSLESPSGIIHLETQDRVTDPSVLPTVGVFFVVGKVQQELSSPFMQMGRPENVDFRQDGTPCPEGTLCWTVTVRALAVGEVVLEAFVATRDYRYGLSNRYPVKICATSSECPIKK